ncbi:MAG: copper homeostasis protein CutC [Calditrichia bacterium]
MKVDLEICINCDGPQSVYDAVSAAYYGGAARVELCAAMHLDGLTPGKEHISEARKAFKDRPGLMVMIRPRADNFCYSTSELTLMKQQIEMAAAIRADGVVFGVLQKTDFRLSLPALDILVNLSRKNNLTTTFHRAFDATPDAFEALQILIDFGVDRVLTSGTNWQGRQPATKGKQKLSRLIEASNRQIEIVIGGGINRSAIRALTKALPIDQGNVSFHAYSASLDNDSTTMETVSTLDEVART